MGESQGSKALTPLTDELQLWSTFNTVTSLIHSSGFGWTHKKGCNISVEKQSLWQAYVAVSQPTPKTAFFTKYFEETFCCKTI